MFLFNKLAVFPKAAKTKSNAFWVVVLDTALPKVVFEFIGLEDRTHPPHPEGHERFDFALWRGMSSESLH